MSASWVSEKATGRLPNCTEKASLPLLVDLPTQQAASDHFKLQRVAIDWGDVLLIGSENVTLGEVQRQALVGAAGLVQF